MAKVIKKTKEEPKEAYKVQYLKVKPEMKAIALKCISSYYDPKKAESILKTCYIERHSSFNKRKGYEDYLLIYPAGGDDWSLEKNLKTEKYSENGHGTFFGKMKTKAQALKIKEETF